MPFRGGRGIGGRGGSSFIRRNVRRTAIIIVVIKGNRYVREYDNSKDGYTNYPIQIKDNKEYYSKENVDYDAKSGEEIKI